jgi:hypothetical protein
LGQPAASVADEPVRAVVLRLVELFANCGKTLALRYNRIDLHSRPLQRPHIGSAMHGMRRKDLIDAPEIHDRLALRPREHHPNRVRRSVGPDARSERTRFLERLAQAARCNGETDGYALLVPRREIP